MNIKISRKGMMWSYLGFGFTIFTNLMIIPFVMKMVETSELGLWYTFLSIGQLVTLLDFGFSNTLVRNITYAWSGISDISSEGIASDNQKNKPNYVLLSSVLKTCQVICLFIGVLAFIVMMTLGLGYISHIAHGIGGKRCYLAWIVYSMAIFLNIYYSYWISSLRGIGAVIEAQKANVYSKSLQIMISLAGLIAGGGIVALSFAYLISGCFIRVYAKYRFYEYQNLKYYISRKEKMSYEKIKSNLEKIWFNSKKSGIVSVTTFCITQTTTLLSSAYLGLEVTASYGLSLQIITAIANLAFVYFQTMLPEMTELKVSDCKNDLRRLFSVCIGTYWILYLIELSAVLIIGLPFIRLLKSDTVLPFAMVGFMGIYIFLENNHSICATYITIGNTIPYMKASLVSGICVVIGELGIVLFTDWGIYGLMMVQCLVQLAYNNWKWPYVVFRELGITPVTVIKNTPPELVRYFTTK